MIDTLQIERRSAFKFTPDPRRVLLRPFIPGNPKRIANIMARVSSLDDTTVNVLLDRVMAEFSGRHIDIARVFDAHFEKVRPLLLHSFEPTRERRLLLGSYFTGEYALESAALFNPSIVPHPDQEDVPPGWVRFIMSLRATGEGHISSIEFRSGIVNDRNDIVIDRPGPFITAPDIVPDPSYDRSLFLRKIKELGFDEGQAKAILDPMPETFALAQLTKQLAAWRPQRPSRAEKRLLEAMHFLAVSNYSVRFPESIALAERIIFPVAPSESNGIEDARFVRFTDDDGCVIYYATYTAYNGHTILPMFLETRDFLSFDVRTLNGRVAQNKGMALFPRKISGQYALISRQDNENLYITCSDHPHFWEESERLMRPVYPWEFVQLGNCGSPIETEVGWLLLTHGVGAMRKYCIGAALLDLEDPRRVIGRLAEPLLSPNENEREGYVPNVVYTCGAMVHNRQLIIPYAMSDTASSIATVPLDALLERLLND